MEEDMTEDISIEEPIQTMRANNNRDGFDI